MTAGFLPHKGLEKSISCARYVCISFLQLFFAILLDCPTANAFERGRTLRLISTLSGEVNIRQRTDVNIWF
jgi:hypothetical protein